MRAGSTATTSPSATPSASASGGATPSAKPTDASDPAQITPQLQAQFDAETCQDPAKPQAQVFDPAKPIVTCGNGSKFVLGPVEIAGNEVKDASAGLKPLSNGQGTSNEWEIRLAFTGEGSRKFGAVTTRLFDLRTTDPVRNQFAIVLDNLVISNAGVESPITNGQASISGASPRPARRASPTP
ncbi:hypothetical protein GCM10025868_04350 [Angustibacter aerolatus]|uniref:SecDF P1 head subdomain domain-containing protein n=1 Tax=Angustibacter aerolatus TaxID=1162965 RepID=A0ABQ6JAG9_9ACTN|nr:hypothetical protein GCM10025868_04350 [Angustibacter aerolatus]